MLTLGRKPNESIVIRTDAGDVTVTVVSIDRGRVRLGFEAPLAVGIFREELLAPPKPK